MFDISCHDDPASNRWFHLAVDLDQDRDTGDFSGDNYFDLAVSTPVTPLAPGTSTASRG